MVQLKYDWLIRLFFHFLLMFIFLFIFLHPLWKLSKSRLAMIIVFSRAIGSLLYLFSQMPTYLMNYIFNAYPPSPIVMHLSNRSITFSNIVLATHILALAVNRAHSIIFPFHYNWFSTKKRNFYIICAFLWLFSLIAASMEQMDRLGIIDIISPFLLVHRICMGTGAICYAALTCQLIWLKYKKNPTLSSGASSDKDQFRILIVCFSCLFMSSIRYLIYEPIANNIPKDWSLIPLLIMTWISFFTGILSICTEEICLLFLVRDFRKDVKKQLGRIFCFFKKSSSTNNINSITIVSSTKNTRAQINNWTQKN